LLLCEGLGVPGLEKAVSNATSRSEDSLLMRAPVERFDRRLLVREFEERRTVFKRVPEMESASCS
jgi:hypothetical protein